MQLSKTKVYKFVNSATSEYFFSTMWTTAKIVSLLVIFGLSFLSGITSCVVVLCLKRKYGISGNFQRIISLLNCFAGGVFFATSVLHLLPEAREKMEEALELWGHKTEYPLTEVLTGAGFLLILTFENVSHLFCSGTQLQKSFKAVKHYTYGDKKPTSNAKIVYTKVPCDECDSSDDEEVHINDSNNDKVNENSGTYQRYSDITENSVDKPKLQYVTGNETGSYNTKSKSWTVEFREKNALFKPNRDIADETKRNDTTSQPPNSEIAQSADNHSRSKVRAVILLAALSFHMVFDGLALGLMDEDNKVWTLLLALCVHKVLVFLSIGLETFELLKSLRKSVFLLLCFAFISPLGIIIGVAVTSSEDQLTQSAAAAILQSIATGTFIYVTFFEILHREFDDDTPDLLKVLCTVVGFALVAAVKMLEGVVF